MFASMHVYNRAANRLLRICVQVNQTDPVEDLTCTETTTVKGGVRRSTSPSSACRGSQKQTPTALLNSATVRTKSSCTAIPPHLRSVRWSDQVLQEVPTHLSYHSKTIQQRTHASPVTISLSAEGVLDSPEGRENLPLLMAQSVGMSFCLSENPPVAVSDSLIATHVGMLANDEGCPAGTVITSTVPLPFLDSFRKMFLCTRVAVS
jgi:hypothetical protein